MVVGRKTTVDYTDHGWRGPAAETWGATAERSAYRFCTESTARLQALPSQWTTSGALTALLAPSVPAAQTSVGDRALTAPICAFAWPDRPSCWAVTGRQAAPSQWAMPSAAPSQTSDDETAASAPRTPLNDCETSRH